jgi:hypothetical protein
MVLEFSHLIHVCPLLRVVVGLVDLVDHQQGVTPNHKVRNTQPYYDPKTGKKALIFCRVVGGVFTGEG